MLALLGWPEIILILLALLGMALMAATAAVLLVWLLRRHEGRPEVTPPARQSVQPRPESASTCPRCGTALPANSPQGLCPRCVLGVGLATHTEAPGETGPRGTKVVKPTPSPEEIAKHFPQLEIMECLGRGGMGVVYKARQPKLNRLVALKILAPERGADPKFAERFQREALALAKLSHPNIVTVHDFGEAEGMFYLLMEFVDGVSLRQTMREGRMKPEEALAIVPRICEALQFAHEQGVVHRDIKPENVLLDKQGRVKIADFGIAKIVADAGELPFVVPPSGGPDRLKPELQTLTQDQVLGTPHYMAPEQVEKPATVDHRADIYSLGVVFYEMLTGELPLGKFQPPSKKVQVDVRLDEVVLRALEKKPELRYQQASALKTQVETIVESSPGSSPASRDEPAHTQSRESVLETPSAHERRRSALLWYGFICSVFGLPAGLALNLPFVWGLSIAGIVIAGYKLRAQAVAARKSLPPPDGSERDPANQPAVNEAEWSNPANWTGPKWLSLYFSKLDARAWVPKQIPALGRTVNLGHPRGAMVLMLSVCAIFVLQVAGAILAANCLPNQPKPSDNAVIAAVIGIVVIMDGLIVFALWRAMKKRAQNTTSTSASQSILIIVAALLIVAAGWLGTREAKNHQEARREQQHSSVLQRLSISTSVKLSELGYHHTWSRITVSDDLSQAQRETGPMRRRIMGGGTQELDRPALRYLYLGDGRWKIVGTEQLDGVRFEISTLEEMARGPRPVPPAPPSKPFDDLGLPYPTLSVTEGWSGWTHTFPNPLGAANAWRLTPDYEKWEKIGNIRSFNFTNGLGFVFGLQTLMRSGADEPGEPGKHGAPGKPAPASPLLGAMNLRSPDGVLLASATPVADSAFRNWSVSVMDASGNKVIARVKVDQNAPDAPFRILEVLWQPDTPQARVWSVNPHGVAYAEAEVSPEGTRKPLRLLEEWKDAPYPRPPDPAADHFAYAAARAVFGPAREVTLHARADGRDCFLDLHTGRVLSPPPDLAETFAATARPLDDKLKSIRHWLLDNGVDLAVHPGELIRFVDGFVCELSSSGNGSTFDQQTPQSVMEMARRFGVSAFPGALLLPPIHGLAGGDGKRTGGWFLFRGGDLAGVIEIQKEGRNTGTWRLRYKLVSDSRAAQTASIDPASVRHRPATEPPSAAAPDKPGHAITLGNGISIEVIAICRNPRGTAEWWRPDGTPLAQSPVEIVDLPKLAPTTRSEITIRPENEYLVYLRRKSPPGMAIESSASTFTPPPTEWEATATVKEWNSKERASALMVYYAEPPDAVAFQEAVACGPWEAVSVYDVKTKQTRDLGRGVMALWSEPRYEQGALRFDVMHNANRELHDLRMVARRRSGGDEKLVFHTGVIRGSPAKGFALLHGSEAEAKARLQQVKELVLERTPWVRGEIGGIAFRPSPGADQASTGHATDPREDALVFSPAADAKRSFPAFASGDSLAVWHVELSPEPLTVFIMEGRIFTDPAPVMARLAALKRQKPFSAVPVRLGPADWAVAKGRKLLRQIESACPAPLATGAVLPGLPLVMDDGLHTTHVPDWKADEPSMLDFVDGSTAVLKKPLNLGIADLQTLRARKDPVCDAYVPPSGDFLVFPTRTAVLQAAPDDWQPAKNTPASLQQRIATLARDRGERGDTRPPPIAAISVEQPDGGWLLTDSGQLLLVRVERDPNRPATLKEIWRRVGQTPPSASKAAS